MQRDHEDWEHENDSDKKYQQIGVLTPEEQETGAEERGGENYTSQGRAAKSPAQGLGEGAGQTRGRPSANPKTADVHNVEKKKEHRRGRMTRQHGLDHMSFSVAGFDQAPSRPKNGRAKEIKEDQMRSETKDRAYGKAKSSLPTFFFQIFIQQVKRGKGEKHHGRKSPGFG